MPAGSRIILFVTTVSLLLITPGPAVLYIIASSLAHGRQAGLISALGTSTGNLLHAVATTLGLSALLASSALAFGAVQYVGAAFLIYCGLRTFKAPVASQEITMLASKPLPRLFFQGVLVNLLNPVTTLFFCAVLPHFIDPVSGPVGAQMLWLGCLYVVLGLCNGSLYALLAGTLSRWLKEHVWCWRILHWLIASVYIVLGLSTAFAILAGMLATTFILDNPPK
jgi:threonine/homoserine/homoserine lactone efflux protein